MKTQVNKSQLMKRAWTIYRESRKRIFGVKNSPVTFSYALTRAWAVEKANAAVKTETVISSSVFTGGMLNMAGAANWYMDSRAGTYFGD